MGQRRGSRKGWQARQVLRRGLSDWLVGDERQAIGCVRFLGDGLYNRAYSAACQLDRGNGVEEITLVVRLPRAGAPESMTADMQREAALLEYLNKLGLPIRTPRCLALVEVETGLAMIQEFLEGIPVEMRAPRCPGRPPWEDIGEAARICHGIETQTLLGIEPPPSHHANRCDHALAQLSVLERVDGSVGEAALEWCRAHLPPATPSRLLHGDLLGQNILRPWEAHEQIAVIDWSEATLGDPAYDLAIVTRGNRKPFQTSGGLDLLLQAYRERGGGHILATDVHFHELCLVAGFLLADIEEFGEGSPAAEHTRNRLAGVLRRARERS